MESQFVPGLFCTLVEPPPDISGPHWLRGDPIIINLEPRFDGTLDGLRPDLQGTETTCSPTAGQVTIGSVFVQNGVVLHHVTFAWAFDGPPAFFLSDEALDVAITGTASGSIQQVPNPGSIFRFSFSFQASDGVFRAYNDGHEFAS